ncbi:MAG: aldo/keto reductase [Coriobacteriia bacterium]|nr:aldo/keto reductase [Coriobacteriia bacterium]MBN2847336.1 aldo/keto reductase [Coriobacteriia bacterium]
MLTGLDDTVRLANGVEMPRLGLGTYKSAEGGDVEGAVTAALELGYRSIDTASLYGNEEGIGRAIAAAGVPRGEIFLTSKVWNDEQGYEHTLAAFTRSLERLGTDYLDLYLVHWPRAETPETWRALERLYAEGAVRAIGVCNHLEHHLEEILGYADIAPMVDQYELHPWLQQPSLRSYCQAHDIVVEAWAPLMKGRVAEEPALVAVAGNHGKSPAQVALRWLLQHGVVTIPKSVHRERIAENGAVFDFTLTPEDMTAIDAADRGHRFGPEPDRGGER